MDNEGENRGRGIDLNSLGCCCHDQYIEVEMNWSHYILLYFIVEHLIRLTFYGIIIILFALKLNGWIKALFWHICNIGIILFRIKNLYSLLRNIGFWQWVHCLSLFHVRPDMCWSIFLGFLSCGFWKSLYFEEICFRLQTNTGNTSTGLEFKLDPNHIPVGDQHNTISRKFHQMQAKQKVYRQICSHFWIKDCFYSKLLKVKSQILGLCNLFLSLDH